MCRIGPNRFRYAEEIVDVSVENSPRLEGFDYESAHPHWEGFSSRKQVRQASGKLYFGINLPEISGANRQPGKTTEAEFRR
jgi:hypothetical protein